jgi:hypothetical protein
MHKRPWATLLMAATLGLPAAALAAPTPAAPPADRAAALLQTLNQLTTPVMQDTPRFGLVVRADQTAPADITQPVAAAPALLELRLDRTGPHEFALAVTSPWVNLTLARDEKRTVMALPDHGVAFVGEGTLAEAPDTLDPQGLLARLVTPETAAYPYVWLASTGQVPAVARQLGLLKFEALDGTTPAPAPVPGGKPARHFRIDAQTQLYLPESSAGTIVLTARGKNPLGVQRLEVAYRDAPTGVRVSTDGLKTQVLDRAEMERVIARGLRRLLSARLPAPTLQAAPAPAPGSASGIPRRVPHGELRVVEGQTLVLLAGTPEEIGTAHGQLLGPQIRRTIDSTLYMVGLVESARTGQWFPATLDDAWKRLSPHIPDAHRREMIALAKACPDVSVREIELANVFPEYFHCSGFAVFGKATTDGTLYHGRVLDYMTEIGLQQAAVTFVVKPQRGFGYLNVGYAGFIGSVSGMNQRQISLGEMGGGGRGLWDGVPMATLMRRALEECSTLDEVKKLWTDSPRTCEYYYVFADGKIPSAVAVAARSEKIEFLAPGAAHPLLGEGIADAVVLSAGDRLKLLRQRVTAQHGKLDATSAMHLMDRPVAMSNNLHNALFVPQQGIVYIANASNDQPAAMRPYVKYDLTALLREVPED